MSLQYVEHSEDREEKDDQEEASAKEEQAVGQNEPEQRHPLPVRVVIPVSCAYGNVYTSLDWLDSVGVDSH